MDNFEKKGDLQGINQDGVVNKADVRLVEKNFLKKNPDTSDTQQRQETIKGKD